MSAAKRGVQSISEQLQTTRRELVAFFSIQYAAGKASQIIGLADEARMLDARLKLATTSAQEYAQAQQDVNAIADRTRAPLSATTDLYGKMAVAMRELGRDQADAAVATEAIAQTLKLSGASAQSSQGALQQFGQALAAGTLRGDEFNSVMEAAPRLAQALAEGLGVPRGALRALAEQGKLTADQVVGALLSQREKLAAEYAQMPITVSDSLINVRNEFMRLVAGFDKATGATNAISGALGTLADHMGAVAAAAGLVTSVMAGRGVAALTAYTAASITNVQAQIAGRAAAIAAAGAATVQHRALMAVYASTLAAGQASASYAHSLRQQVVASAAATQAARAKAASMGLARSAMSALGGPAGVIATAVTALGMWMLSTKSAAAETERLSFAAGGLADNMTRVTSAAAAGRIVQLKDALAKMGDNPAGAAKLREMIAENKQIIQEAAEQQARIQAELDRATAGKPGSGADKDAGAAAKIYEATRTPQEQFLARLADVSRLLKLNKLDLDTYNRAALMYVDDLDRQNTATKELTQSTEGWAAAQADNLRRIQSMLDDANPNESAARAYLADYRLLAQYLEGPELEAAVQAIGNAFAGHAGQVQESASEIEQIYKDTASSIRGVFRDTFRDVFDAGARGFKGLGDRMLGVFKSMLADMATLAIARPVIVPVVSAMGGMLGVSGSAQASVIQQLGGAAGGVSAMGTFGTGMMAGLQGGFGAASSLAGTTTLATSAGAFLGAALPWVGGALALNALTGGGLFGTKMKTRDSGLELSYSGGDVAGRGFDEQSKKRALFGGTKRRTLYGEADAETINALNATFDAVEQAIVSGAQGLGISTAQEFLGGFSSGTQRVSLKGLSGEAAKAALEKWTASVTAEMYQGLLKGGAFEGLIRQFETVAKKLRGAFRFPEIKTDPAKIKAMGDALFSLGRYFDSNSGVAFAEAQRLAGRTLRTQLADQYRATLALSRVYDGSIDATQRLAQATHERYQLELQYLSQIDEVRRGAIDTLQGSIETIKRSAMDKDSLYSYLASQSETLAQQLQTEGDPARIQALVGQINSLANEAYGLLGQGGAAYAQQYMQFLQGVQDTATRQLDAASQQVRTDQQSLSNTIERTMQAVADQMKRAADAQMAAAGAAQRAAEAQIAASRWARRVGY